MTSLLFLLSANLVVRLFHIRFIEHTLFSEENEITENAIYKRHGLRVSVDLVAISFPMSEGFIRGVILSVIYHGRGDLVAYAFYGIFVGHKRRNLAVRIEPVFYMVLVSSLVVQPCAADARLAAADPDGRAVAAIILYTLKKLSRGEF